MPSVHDKDTDFVTVPRFCIVVEEAFFSPLVRGSVVHKQRAVDLVLRGPPCQLVVVEDRGLELS